MERLYLVEMPRQKVGKKKLGLQEKRRIIDTFAARNLKTPRIQEPIDSLSEYLAKEKYGVELHRRRRDKKNYTII